MTSLGTLLDHLCSSSRSCTTLCYIWVTVVSLSFFCLSEIFLFFRVEDNGIFVEYAYSFLRLIFKLPNLDFITAHFSLITAKMCSVTPYFRPCLILLIILLPLYWAFCYHSTGDSTPILLPFLLWFYSHSTRILLMNRLPFCRWFFYSTPISMDHSTPILLAFTDAQPYGAVYTLGVPSP